MGFNLIELVFALGLFAVMALCLLSLFVTASAAQDDGSAYVRSMSVACGQINHCKTLPYNSLLGYISTPLAPYNVTEAGVTYRMTLTVTRVSSSSAAPEYSLLDLRLQTTWLQKQSLHQGGASEVDKDIVVHSVVGPSSSY